MLCAPPPLAHRAPLHQLPCSISQMTGKGILGALKKKEPLRASPRLPHTLLPPRAPRKPPAHPTPPDVEPDIWVLEDGAQPQLEA